MSKYLVLVCHTETCHEGDPWSWFDEILDAMGRIADLCPVPGKRPLYTFCLTAEAAEDKTAFFSARQREGHELGVHAHPLGSHNGSRRKGHCWSKEFAFRVDEEGISNYERAAEEIRAIMIERGLGAPQTHVSVHFMYRPQTIAALEKFGYTVDCSLHHGAEKRKLPDEVGEDLWQDNRRLTCAAPYRLSYDDFCQPGNSSVIELPLWGFLNEDGARFTLDYARESLRSGVPMAHLREADWRKAGNGEGIPHSGNWYDIGPEVLQMFFHYQNLLIPGGGQVSEAAVHNLERFVAEWASIDGCEFATASEAAEIWKKHEAELRTQGEAG